MNKQIYSSMASWIEWLSTNCIITFYLFLYLANYSVLGQWEVLVHRSVDCSENRYKESSDLLYINMAQIQFLKEPSQFRHLYPTYCCSTIPVLLDGSLYRGYSVMEMQLQTSTLQFPALIKGLYQIFLPLNYPIQKENTTPILLLSNLIY